MKHRLYFLMLVTSLLVLVTSVSAEEVRTDYDHHVNFSEYKTYSWAKVETSDSIWDERVKEAVDKELAATRSSPFPHISMMRSARPPKMPGRSPAWM
jgi:hypothetical protein